MGHERKKRNEKKRSDQQRLIGTTKDTKKSGDGYESTGGALCFLARATEDLNGEEKSMKT